jgi:hypothetical protein
MIKYREFSKVHFFQLKISKYAENLDIFPQIKHLHVDGPIGVPYMRDTTKRNHKTRVKFLAI